MVKFKLSLKKNWKDEFKHHKDLIDMVREMEKEYNLFDYLPQETLGLTTYVGIKLHAAYINEKTMEVESIPVYFTHGIPNEYGHIPTKEIGTVKVLRE